MFNPKGDYTLTDLNDLVGVKVFVFPRTRLLEVDSTLRAKFTD